MKALGLLCCLFILSLAPAAHAERRMAVVVGANAAPSGRQALRYAHGDAGRVARVLEQLGGFDPASVALLLDPEPEAVLAALDRAAAALRGAPDDSLLVFYYSGHADERQLYPGGKALALAELRARLDGPHARVRLGILDACRGGAWTGSKGLAPSEPFEIGFDLPMQNAGSVLIASSSGLEAAHESKQLLGSYFTHHLVAALRGAGDRDADQIVSLVEAYEYARERTVRDTSVQLGQPQRPSFHLNLKGRRDLPLSTLGGARSSLRLIQDRGPLSVVHVDSGTLLADVPEGKRTILLAVPAGRYIVRTAGSERLSAAEVVVLDAGATVVYERNLPVADLPWTAAKGAEHARPALASHLRAGQWSLALYSGVRSQDAFNARTLLASGADEFQLGDSPAGAVFGLREGVAVSGSSSPLLLLANARYGFSDRLEWGVGTLAFSYLGGVPGGFEWIVSFGLLPRDLRIGEADPSFPAARHDNVSWQGLLQLDLRWWFSPHSSVMFGTALRTTSGSIDFSDHCQPNVAGCLARDTDFSLSHALRARTAFTFSQDLGDRLTLNLGLGFTQELATSNLRAGGEDIAAVLLYGSAQMLGFKPLPLLQAHLTDAISLDLLATGVFSPGPAVHGVELLGGVGVVF